MTPRAEESSRRCCRGDSPLQPMSKAALFIRGLGDAFHQKGSNNTPCETKASAGRDSPPGATRKAPSSPTRCNRTGYRQACLAGRPKRGDLARRPHPEAELMPASLPECRLICPQTTIAKCSHIFSNSASCTDRSGRRRSPINRSQFLARPPARQDQHSHASSTPR